MPDSGALRPDAASDAAAGASARAADASVPPARPITPIRSALNTPPTGEVKTLCERCGAETYRMHAVWRCPACGFKTDCCGW